MQYHSSSSSNENYLKSLGTTECKHELYQNKGHCHHKEDNCAWQQQLLGHIRGGTNTELAEENAYRTPCAQIHEAEKHIQEEVCRIRERQVKLISHLAAIKTYISQETKFHILHVGKKNNLVGISASSPGEQNSPLDPEALKTCENKPKAKKGIPLKSTVVNKPKAKKGIPLKSTVVKSPSKREKKVTFSIPQKKCSMNKTMDEIQQEERQNVNPCVPVGGKNQETVDNILIEDIPDIPANVDNSSIYFDVEKLSNPALEESVSDDQSREKKETDHQTSFLKDVLSDKQSNLNEIVNSIRMKSANPFQESNEILDMVINEPVNTFFRTEDIQSLTQKKKIQITPEFYKSLGAIPKRLQSVSDKHTEHIIREPTSRTSNTASMCRICHCGSKQPGLGRLIAPCNCKGTVGLVHVACLDRWLTESGAELCELCGYKFHTERIPRHGRFSSLMLWLRHGSDCKQLVIDLLWFVFTTPLAAMASYLELFAVNTLLQAHDAPWAMVVMLVCCGLTLAAYYGWVVGAVRHHSRDWYRWWRTNYNVHILTEEDEYNDNDESVTPVPALTYAETSPELLLAIHSHFEEDKETEPSI